MRASIVLVLTKSAIEASFDIWYFIILRSRSVRVAEYASDVRIIKRLNLDLELS